MKRPKTGARRLVSTQYAEATVRQYVDWTPAQRRAAMAMADGGSLRLAADLVESCMADDRVIGCLGARVRGLFGLAVSFEEGVGIGRKRRKAIRALEAEEDFWASFPEPQLALLMSWAIVLGIGVAEIVWQQKGSRLLPTLKVWHPRWLRFDWSRHVWRITTADGTEIDITPGDGKWVLLTPYGTERPWAHGAWRAVSLAWLAKTYDVQDWSRHNERHGSPILVGESPDGAQEEDWKDFGADLAALNGRTTMALPPGYKLQLAEAKSQSFQTFSGQIAWSDKAIAISLLGQNLTTDISAGSLAAATIHQEVRGDFIRADAESLATTLHDQALTWWAQINFGDSNLAPWPAWETSPPEDKQKRATTLLALAQAVSTLKTAGYRPKDTDELSEQFGFELEELEEPSPAPANDNEAAIGGEADGQALDSADAEPVEDAEGDDADAEAPPPGNDDD